MRLKSLFLALFLIIGACIPCSAQEKIGTQKVLCIMVNSEDEPFKTGHDERYYSNMLFGKSKNSLASYISRQSLGKFKIKPADTKKTKYPGIIQVSMKSKTVAADDYNFQSKIVVSALNHISDRLNLKAIDINGDKRFAEPFLIDDKNAKEEFLIITIISGSVKSEDDVEDDKVKAWPHLEQIHTDINGYAFRNTSIISSEIVEGKGANVSTFAHEFMHNLNARDMYLDRTSIGTWSIMSEPGKDTPNELDPVHKIYLGWATPKPVRLNSTVKFDKGKIPYIKCNGYVYLLDYREEKDGAIVWKINEKELKRDWKFDDSNECYDWYVNSSGDGKAIQVLPKPDSSYIKCGKGMKISNTNIRIIVTHKKIHVTNKG